MKKQVTRKSSAKPSQLAAPKPTPIYDRIREILESARTSVARSVNTTQVVANWLVGREIFEEEQRGQDRAGYGEELLKTLSGQLNRDFGRGYSVSALQYMRAFFLAYPSLLEKQHALCVESSVELPPNIQHAARVELGAKPSGKIGYAARSQSSVPSVPPQKSAALQRISGGATEPSEIPHAARAQSSLTQFSRIGHTACDQSSPPITATPFIETARGTTPFQNVIYDYPLAKAMSDGFVKEPAVVTQKNFDPSQFSPEELEKIKLEDGVRLHENVKVELETYARQTSQAIVKPFLLVIARDTTHASQLLQLLESDKFFEGRDKGLVIQVDSSKTGAEEDEMIRRLLDVEKTEEPTEIVIHVNMLKEGWDVTNLYTIVPLRAANARTLIEQSIGRGLRLPYGKRTGVKAVDRLNIVAPRFDVFAFSSEAADDSASPSEPDSELCSEDLLSIERPFFRGFVALTAVVAVGPVYFLVGGKASPKVMTPPLTLFSTRILFLIG